MKVKLNQIYKNKYNDFQIIISGKKGGCHWLAKVLTDKPGVFNGTHSMSEYTLKNKYELL